MTRPQIVRADTIDLQSHDAPSAKDHSRQPTHPGPLGAGPPAPHQSQALKHAEQEAIQEQNQSPRASEERTAGQNGTEEAEYYDEPEQMNENDNVMDQGQSMQNGSYRRNADQGALNGGYSNASEEETLIGDQEGDDEDMMDKISSSPSIDDGGYPLPPLRRASATAPAKKKESTPSPMSAISSSSQDSSSPFTAAPDHYPLSPFETFRRTSSSSSMTGSRKFSPLSVFGRLPNIPPLKRAHSPSPSSVSGNHHQSQGGYLGRTLSAKPSSSSLLSADSSSTVGSSCSETTDRPDFPSKAKRLPQGHHQIQEETDRESGTDSIDSRDCSDDAEAETGSTCSEETVREENRIQDCFLPDQDPLLEDADRDKAGTISPDPNAPEPHNPDLGSPEPNLTDDDSSVDSLNEAEPTEAQLAYMDRVRQLKAASSSFFSKSTFQAKKRDDDGSRDKKNWMNDDALYANPRYVGYGWNGRCLQYSEDIDFEFVYALHTFVATVEGQANCTKGDTMVLLDDSNSYWWLVRVVKDGSIGYLPAEHIETPTERLARLNKHRNIDLAQTMLGDNPEKSKNPLKKAMKRRNAKTVQFAAPTYVEPSDVDYSSEEEAGEQVYGDQVDPQTQGQESQQVAAAVVEPLKIKTSSQGAGPNTDSGDNLTSSPEKTNSGDDMLADKQEGSSPRSRNGVLRNTDSFFKDDKAETKKITLTPNLLRDDSGKDIVEKELKTSASLETFEKIVSPTENVKEDKRRKEKKPGMLSSLFKRRDRKSKLTEDDTEEPEKLFEDSLRKESSESSSQESRSSKSIQPSSPQRQPSKLQKSPPPDLSPIRTTGFQSLEPQSSSNATTKVSPILKENVGPSLRQVDTEPQQSAPHISNDKSPDTEFEESPEQPGANAFAPLTNPPKSALTSRAHQRYVDGSMDDFDSLDEPEQKHEDTPTEAAQAQHPTAIDRLSESPIQVSPTDAHAPHDPPGLMVDTSSQEEPFRSPISPASSTEIIERHESKSSYADATPASTATSSAPTPTWSDASLRAYMDSDQDQDIRDMIAIVHDTTGVQPAGSDHPVIGPLYRDERRRLAELQLQLDRLHRGYLDRKGILY